MALFRMEYWKDGPWFVGRLPQIPGVFSQGATLQELEDNLGDAYRIMLAEQGPVRVESGTRRAVPTGRQRRS